MKQKHTQTPWRVGDAGRVGDAVNSHAALIEALESLIAGSVSWDGYPQAPTVYAVNRARAALAAAKGE